MNPMHSILEKAKKKEVLNILTAPTHEAYETNLAMTGHNFYALNNKDFKQWNTKYRPIPKNYIPIDDLLPNVVIDLVLSQNKFGQYQVLAPIAKQLHVPLISLEHTLPVPFWSQEFKKRTTLMTGDINVFISDFSIQEWGFSEFDPTVRVVRHGIDTNQFKPDSNVVKTPVLFSCVNDWVNRDWCCGFNIWSHIITNNGSGPTLPHHVLGDTPGLSLPAKSTEELINTYQQSLVFLNTSTISPIPTVLLEAMSCGCAVVSTATCMIPEVIKHGYNGLISNDVNELRKYCIELLENPELAKTLGDNARDTIVNNFSQQQFVNSWNDIFTEANNVIFRG